MTHNGASVYFLYELCTYITLHYNQIQQIYLNEALLIKKTGNRSQVKIIRY